MSTHDTLNGDEGTPPRIAKYEYCNGSELLDDISGELGKDYVLLVHDMSIDKWEKAMTVGLSSLDYLADQPGATDDIRDLRQARKGSLDFVSDTSAVHFTPIWSNDSEWQISTGSNTRRSIVLIAHPRNINVFDQCVKDRRRSFNETKAQTKARYTASCLNMSDFISRTMALPVGSRLNKWANGPCSAGDSEEGYYPEVLFTVDTIKPDKFLSYSRIPSHLKAEMTVL